RVATWELSYRSKTVQLSHDDMFFKTVFHQDRKLWEDLEWTAEMDKEVTDYLQDRWYGSCDWMKFQPAGSSRDVAEVGRQIGIDFSKPTIALLTNVLWDAQLCYPTN